MEFKDDDTVAKDVIEAFLKGKKEAEQLIKDGIDVNMKDSESKSVIQHVIEQGNTELIEFLLDQGAEIGEFEAVQLANQKGPEELVIFLLQRFYSVDRRDNSKIDQKALDLCLLHFVERVTTLKIVELILSFGANSNAKDEDGTSALQFACEAGNKSIIHLLLDKGADLYYKNPDLQTALHFAVCSINSNLVEWLLNEGFQVNEENDSGANALWLAVRYSNAKVVEILLERGANVQPTISEDGECSTILHEACQNVYGNEAIVKLILETGIDINKVNEKDHTPLDCATDEEHEEIVKLLLESGADISEMWESGGRLLRMAVERQNENLVELFLSLHKFKENKTNYLYESALELAAGYKNTTIFKLLLNHSNGYLSEATHLSVLQSAVNKSQEDVVKLILESGAISDIKQHKDLLFSASKKGCKNIVEALLKCGFDANCKDDQGHSALYYALLNKSVETGNVLRKNGARIDNDVLQAGVRSCYIKIVRKALESDVDVNWRMSARTYSALELSTIFKRFEIFEALWNHGGKLNAERNCRNVPLLNFACYAGNIKVVKFLLDQGADVHDADQKGIDCLIAAVDGGCLEISKMLLEKGINVETRDSFGRTALSAALLNCNKRYKYIKDNLYNSRPQPDKDSCKWVKLVEQLSDFGAYLSPKNQDDYKNFKFICKNGYLSKLELLISYNLDIEFIDKLFKRFDVDSVPLRQTVTITTKYYILKAQSVGAIITEVTSQKINKSNFLSKYRIECEEEIKLLKETKVANTTISFYDILTSNSLDQLAAYATTANVQKAFSLKYKISSEYQAKFPIYYDMVRYQVKKGIWRKLLLSKLTNFFNAVAKAEGNEGLSKLPALCVAEIFSYLTNRDLQTLHSVCNVKLGIDVFDVSVNYEQ